MAGEYDKDFEKLSGLVETLTTKVDRSLGGIDDLRMEVRDVRNEVRDLRSNLRENVKETKMVGRKVDSLAGQFRDVGIMAIKDHKRIDNLEERVDVLESEAR
jgi:chromosome segregation ATPase